MAILTQYMTNMRDLARSLFQFPAPFLRVYPRFWLAAFVILVILDLVSKLAVTHSLNFHLTPYQYPRDSSGISALMDKRDQIDILGDEGKYIKLRLVFNDRFVFGSGPSAPVMGFFLTLFAVCFLILYRWHNPRLGHWLAWLCVFSGAFGNLVDKMFVKSLVNRDWIFSIGPSPGHVSGVVDFVECIWFGWERAATMCIGTNDWNVCPLSFLSWQTWPTFNLADSLIVCGICLLLITMKEEKKASA